MESFLGSRSPKRIAKTPLLRCQACLFEFESTLYLLNHLSAVANDTVHKNKPAECAHCELIFPSIIHFFKHVDAFHKSWKWNSPIAYPENDPQSIAATKSKRKSTRKCEKCGKEFKKNSDFDRHLVTHSKAKAFECIVCGAKFGLETNLNVHKRSHDESKAKDQFPCAVCRKEYLSLSALKLHLRSHTNETPLICGYPKCDQSFRTSKLRRDHVTRDHKKLVKKVPKAVTDGEKQSVIQLLTDLGRPASPKRRPSHLMPSSASAFSSLSQPSAVKRVVAPPRQDCRSLLVKIQPYFVVPNPGPQLQLMIFVSFRLLENLSRDGMNLRVPLNFDMFSTGASLLIDPHSTLSQFAYPLSQYSVVAQPIPEGSDAIMSSECSLMLRVPANVAIPAQYLVSSSLHDGEMPHQVAFSLSQVDTASYEQSAPVEPCASARNYWSFTPIDDLMFFPASPCDNEIAELTRSRSIMANNYDDEYYGIPQGMYGRFSFPR